MIPWKQRLYAFLLRRVLEPILEPESLQQLQESLEISLQDGILALTDVHLRTQFVESKLWPSSPQQQQQQQQPFDDQSGSSSTSLPTNRCPPIHIRRATVERLEIQLRLLEHDEPLDVTDVDVEKDTALGDGGGGAGAGAGSGATSFAWRALQLGYAASIPKTTPTVSLAANVELRGIVIEIESTIDDDIDSRESTNTKCAYKQQQWQERRSSTAAPTADPASSPAMTTPPAKGFLATYLDAALSSLRLTVQLHHVCLRLATTCSQQQQQFSASSRPTTDIAEPWLELRIQTIRYHNVAGSSDPGKRPRPGASSSPPVVFSSLSTSLAHTVLHKAVEISKMTLLVGCNRSRSSIRPQQQQALDPTTATTVLLLDGTSHIRLLAVEYIIPSDIGNKSSSHSDAASDEDKLQTVTHGPRVQHDLEIILHQNLQVSLNAFALQQLLTVTQRFQRAISKLVDARGDSRSSPRDQQQHEPERDVTDGIIQQYEKARYLAEHHQIRGGILVPSRPGNSNSNEAKDDGYDDDDDDMNFDVFFDANDQSFYRYSTVMRESILNPPVYATTTNSNSNNNNNAPTSVGDWTHTKLQFHLQQAGMKLILNSADPTGGGRTDVYVLLTLEDCNVSSCVAFYSSNHAISIGRLEIEDSHVVGHDRHQEQQQPLWMQRRVEIGSILRFQPLSDHDETMGELVSHPDDEVLIHASPNISIHVKTETKNKRMLVEVDCILDSIEMTYQHATMIGLSQLLKSIPRSLTRSSTATIEVTRNESRKDYVGFKCFVSCPSLAIELPVLRQESEPDPDWRPLFARCGFSDNERAPESNLTAFGIWLDRPSLELNQDDFVIETTRDMVVASCDHIVVYATTPTSKRVLERRALKTDLMVLGGHVAIDPAVPVSLRVIRCTKDSQESDNVGAASFPSAPTIASFKARQHDDDEDNRIDRILASKLRDLNLGGRNELRGQDPQVAMICAASRSDMVIEVEIPEWVVDVSATELALLGTMLSRTIPASPNVPPSAPPSDPPPPQQTTTSCWSLSLSCDLVSFTLHDHEALVDLDGRNRSDHVYSYAVNLKSVKSHVFNERDAVRHVRFLANDMEFSELSGPAMRISSPKSLSAKDRRTFMRGRSTGHSVLITPILYRSQLFAPISRQSPVILIDLINNQWPARRTGVMDLQSRSVHLTLYDLTYRFDFESQWVQRLAVMFEATKDPGIEADQTAKEAHISTETLTRIFLSISDCNVDYTSPKRFKTASRCILRCGDFRLSSNVMMPAPNVQGCSLSIGEVELCLCNSRFPYEFEDSRLIYARTCVDMTSDPFGLTSSTLKQEAAQRSMNYRTVLMLDAMDAVAAVSLLARSKSESDPKIRASFTVGELGIYASKDSFSLLTTTIGELSTEWTSLSEDAFQTLKTKPSLDAVNEDYCDSSTDSAEDAGEVKVLICPLDELRKQSALRPAAGTANQSVRPHDFLLDGYDWTTIEMDATDSFGLRSGEEQAARWYSSARKNSHPVDVAAGVSSPRSSSLPQLSGPRIIHYHFPLHAVHDPLGHGDMGIAKYLGDGQVPGIQTRILVHDFAIKLRFFDGYDWPEELDDESRFPPSDGSFVINEKTQELDELKKDATQNIARKMKDDHTAKSLERKAKLMGDLLEVKSGKVDNFEGIPLPEERSRKLKEQAKLRRLARRSTKYFQFAASGICMRVDSLEEAADQRLKSCMTLTAKDFFLAETISSDRPVKMIGEWLNDADHPRDSRDGLLMLKMVTWHPRSWITSDNKIANDEVEGTLKILPLRCKLDQRAIRFARCFFRSEDGDKPNKESQIEAQDSSMSLGDVTKLHAVPPPLFRLLRVRPFKLKVDYQPQSINTKALRDGALVELINLSPLDELVLTLQDIDVVDEIGFGNVLGKLVRGWIEDICSTQILKFLSNARPFEPITRVSGSAADMIVLPWEAFQNGESIQRAMLAGASSFTKAVAFEAFTMTSRMAEFLAIQTSTWDGSSNQYQHHHHHYPQQQHSHGNTAPNTSVLPSRPLKAPRGILDATPHAVESLARGLQTANYKIVIVPYREYRRNGATGAVRSVLRGIPVAIAAPASGAAEAISFAMLGARNQVRPDIWKEEDAGLRGLHLDNM